MTKAKFITWREVTGNKYNRALHASMFSGSNYRKHVHIRRTGDFDKSVFEVEYDKEYGITWLSKKVTDPLRNLGLKKILELVTEAYEISSQNNNSRVHYLPTEEYASKQVQG